MNSSRLLIQMYTPSSTNKTARMFAYPEILLKMSKPGDLIIDLNLEYQDKSIVEIKKGLDGLIKRIHNQDKDKEIVVNMGEFPIDCESNTFFEYFLHRLCRPATITGTYPAIYTNRFSKITQKGVVSVSNAQQFDIRDVFIPNDFLDRYPKVNGKKRASMRVTWGCPRECSMCPVVPIYNKHYKSFDQNSINKNVEKIIKYHELGVRYITFTDDNLGVDKKRFKKFLQTLCTLKLKGMKYLCQEGFEVTTFQDKEICQLLAKLSFVDVKMGMESIDPRFLKRIKKYYSDDSMILKALENIKESGLKVGVFLLLGVGETYQDVMNNIHFIAKHKLQVRVNIFNPVYGTELYEKPPKQIISDIELKHLKALTYASSWASTELGIDIFEKDALNHFLKKLNLQGKYKKYGNRQCLTIYGPLPYFGIQTSRFRKALIYIINSKYRNKNKPTKQGANLVFDLTPQLKSIFETNF